MPSCIEFRSFWEIVFHSLKFRMLADESAIKTDEVLIGGSERNLVVMKTTSIPGCFNAVIDTQNPFRVFIGHSLYSACQGSTFGAVFYFDKNGSQNGFPKTFKSPLFVFDSRDLRIESVKEEMVLDDKAADTNEDDCWKKTKMVLNKNKHHLFLCGDTLALVW